jgi:hypothetical protein
VSRTELPWTVGPALVLALSVCWLLERKVRGRATHGVVALCSFAAGFVVHMYLHPWDGSSIWLKGLSAFLVVMAVTESSQAILKAPNRKAT